MSETYEEMEEYLDNYRRKIELGGKVGTDLARQLAEQIDPHETAVVSEALANLLLGLDATSGDCTTLSHEWMLDRYWGIRIKNDLHLFDEIYEGLRMIGADSRDRSLKYGDLDYSIWAEEEVAEVIAYDGGTFERRRQMVWSDDHCTCTDDNITVWIREWSKFHCRKTRWSTNDGEDDDKILPFDLKYGDFRDKGYAFSFDELTEKTQGALHYYGVLSRAVDHLRMIREALDNPDPRDLPQ